MGPRYQDKSWCGSGPSVVCASIVGATGTGARTYGIHPQQRINVARFYASIQGQRGEATRMGSASSGIRGHVRGWNVGVAVEGRDDSGRDVFDVFATGGSNGTEAFRLGTVQRMPGGERRVVFIPTT